MPVTFVEDNESRSATIVRKGLRGDSTYTKSWKAFGTSDDSELHLAINTQLSQLYGWQYPNQPGAQLWVESYTVSYLGDEAWQVTANYKKTGIENDEQRDPLKRARHFDTTGGTQHKTQAEGETAYAVGNNVAPSQYRAIGVDGDSVSGVDIVAPALQWTEEYEVPASYVTAGYIKEVARLTGTVNNATFRTFAAGEVLFVGCTGSQEWDDQRGHGPWKLSYKFVASPNAGTGQTLPAIIVGGMSGIEKQGHEYMWVRYEAESDSASKTLLKRPKYVYVNKVYREASFSGLGIGVA
jgi:hypothetical protein